MRFSTNPFEEMERLFEQTRRSMGAGHASAMGPYQGGQADVLSSNDVNLGMEAGDDGYVVTHLPSEGTLQRSFTLLVHYRSRGVFSLRSRCLRCSRGISNPRYSGTDAQRTDLDYGVVTLCHALFQGTSSKLSADECQSKHHIGRETFGLGCIVFTRGY